MISEKRILIFVMLIFLIYSAFLIYFFDGKINDLFTIVRIDKQKEVLNLAISYNKKIKESNSGEKIKLDKELTLISGQLSYFSLLNVYKLKIKLNMIFSIGALSFIILILIIIIFYFFLKEYLYPFKLVLNSLNNFIKNKKIDKIIPKGNSRIKKFLESFNLITEQLVLKRTEEKIKSFFDNWQTLARIIVHEIKNQISPLSLNVEALLHYGSHDSIKNDLDTINSNLKSIEKIVNNLKSLSNLPEPVCIYFNLADLINEIILKMNFNKNNIQMTDTITEIFVLSDKFYLELIFVNLLKNAKESVSVPENLEIKIILEHSEKKKILIKDNGSGIDENILPNIFKPGFTTKNSGDGTGLFLVKELCNCLDIKINVESDKKSGTTFSLEFQNESF